MIKLNMYQKIQKLKNIGHTWTSIVSITGLDIKTVKKYSNMSEEAYKSYFASYRKRAKCFEIFEKEIIEIWNNANSSRLSSSAVYDLLEERHGELPATERSFRSYMAYLKMDGKFVSKKERIYEPVEQLPMGKQLQVDFGQYKMKDGIKYYIFAAILSASRYRYIKLFESPLRTSDLIQSLNDCFAYCGGIPEEIAIDQDRLMVVNENKGDIVLTKDFASYKDEIGFNLYVCRKADPESKGKVENLVNFVKRSFLSTRNFATFDEAQLRLGRWLVRKANGKRCAATGQIPMIHIAQERKYLKAIKNSIFDLSDNNLRELRKVDKLGQISVNAVKLSVPHEYRLQTVSVFISSNEVHIFDIKTEEKIALYTLKKGISKMPIVRQKSLRAAKNSELKSDLCKRFQFKNWNQFVETNFQTYRRYFIDQYNDFLRKLPHMKNMKILEEATDYCVQNNTVSMSQLADTYKYLMTHDQRISTSNAPEYKLLSTNKITLPIVASGNINDYMELVEQDHGMEVT